MSKTESVSRSVIAKQLQESLNEKVGHRLVSVDLADDIFMGIWNGLVERAKKKPISIRGIGRLYVITGKSGKSYLRIKHLIKESKGGD